MVQNKLLTIDIESLKKSKRAPGEVGRRARRKWKILKRDNFQCCECGSKEDLTIAHIKPIHTQNRNACCYRLDNCRTLCERCHLK